MSNGSKYRNWAIAKSLAITACHDQTLFLKTIHASTMIFETLKYDDIYSMKKKTSTNFVTLELWTILNFFLNFSNFFTTKKCKKKKRKVYIYMS